MRTLPRDHRRASPFACGSVGSAALWILLVAMGNGPRTSAAADGPIVTDRPSFSTGTSITTTGRVQLEAGYRHIRVRDVKLNLVGEVLGRIGLSRQLELRLGFGSWSDIDGPAGTASSGFTNTALGVKYRFLEGEAARPTLSVVASAILPTGARSFSDDRLVPELNLQSEWGLSEDLGLLVNLGGILPYDGERYVAAWLSAMWGIVLGERWSVFLEGYGYDQETIRGPSTVYLDGGVAFLINDDLQLDAVVGRGFNGIEEDYQAGVGLSVRW